MNTMDLMNTYYESLPVYVAMRTAKDGYTYQDGIIKYVSHSATGKIIITVEISGRKFCFNQDEVFDNPCDAISFAIELAERDRAHAVNQVVKKFDQNIEKLKVRLFQLQS